MKDCWSLKPESRPTFATLVQQLSNYLESMTSYVKLCNECRGDNMNSGDGDVIICNESKC